MGTKSVSGLRSVARPERGPRNYLKVLPICPGPWTSTVILSQTMFGYCVYWNGFRTIAEMDRPRPKPGEKEFRGLRWYGFLAVQITGGVHRLVQITETAVQYCPELEQLDGELRGRSLGLKRLGSSRNSPMRVRFGEVPLIPVSDPGIDLAACVQSLYGIEPTNPS
jgi:hypothetical protein